MAALQNSAHNRPLQLSKVQEDDKGDVREKNGDKDKTYRFLLRVSHM